MLYNIFINDLDEEIELDRSVCLLEIGRLYRGIWTGWMSGLRPAVWGSTRPSVRFSTWVITTPCDTTSLGQSGWRASWWKRTWRCWSTASWMWDDKVPRWPGRLMVSMLVSKIVRWAGSGKWSSSCTQHLWGYTWNTVWSFGSFTTSTMRSRMAMKLVRGFRVQILWRRAERTEVL